VPVFDPVMYKKKMNHTIMTGIAAGKKRATLDVLENSSSSNKGLYKTGVSLGPTGILNKLL
jgi:hypothetical protein